MWVLLRPHDSQEPLMQTVTTIGLDIAKSVFQVHGWRDSGRWRRKRRRPRRREEMARGHYQRRHPRELIERNNARVRCRGQQASDSCVPSPACSRTRVYPSSATAIPGRSRKHPTSAGGTGWGHTSRFVRARPHPTPLPQAGEGADRASVGVISLRANPPWHPRCG